MARDTTFSDSSSNRSLVRRLADGSHDAWGDMVSLYGPLVAVWCRRSRVPEKAVADIAQETFLSAFRSLHRFNPDQAGATFRGWLWTITNKRIADYFRRTHFESEAQGGSTANAFIAELADPVSIDEHAEEPSLESDLTALTARAMQRVRDEFEDRTWQMFLDVAVAGHPTSVVAERFDVSTATVRQSKSRILRRLRLELGDVM